MILGMGMMLALVGVCNYYIVKRLQQSISYVFPKVRKGVYIGLFILLTLLLVMGFARSSLPLSDGFKHTLGLLSFYWMGLFVYLLLFFLIADLVLLICRLFKLFPKPLPHKHRAIAGALALILALGTSCYGCIHVNQIQRADYDVALTSKTLEGQVKLAVISDLHLGAAGSEKRLKKVVERVQETNPDVICIVGDIFDSDYNAIRDPQAAENTLKTLSATYGVYAALGNHDAGKTFNDMVAFLQRSNITLLDDKYITIHNRFILAGRLDGSPIGGYNKSQRKPLEQVLAGANTALPVVVMEHNPARGDEYKPGDADVILSGHTHMGQIFPANLFTDLIYTVDYGYYQESANMPHRIVTSGAGIWGMPMRVGTDCEVVKVILHS